ncbi:hypothetical protein BJ742DRAFT_254671 [Cladochytrium replicatum]|nr:hypothetical protein BJ742DRAFT_254671 [Cladochytrium replicatum]
MGNHDYLDVVAQSGNPSDHFLGNRNEKRWIPFHASQELWNQFICRLEWLSPIWASTTFQLLSIYERTDVDMIEVALMPSRVDKRVNRTFVTSHFDPLQSHLAAKYFQERFQFISLYLCGHLHRLLWGLGEKLYAYQKRWNLQLELGDCPIMLQITVTFNAIDEMGLVGSARHIFRVDGQRSEVRSGPRKNITHAKGSS